MPFSFSCDKEGIGRAIAHYIRKGRPKDQAVAIAYSICGRSRKDMVLDENEIDESLLTAELIAEALEAYADILATFDEDWPQERIESEFDSDGNSYQKSADCGCENDGSDNVYSIAYGDCIKALANDRIGGHLVVFGDKDHRDLQHEFFTPNTEFALDFYEKRPVLYHHGLDETIGIKAIATIDTIKKDDVGLWVEGQLALRDKYMEAIKQLIAAGKLSWSSGSLPHLVNINENGEIKKWPIIEGSITPTPAEPRHTGVTQIKSIPARYLINEDNAISKSEQLTIPKSEQLTGDVSVGQKGTPSKQTIKTDNSKRKGIKMLTDEQKAAVRDRIAAVIGGTEMPPEAQAALVDAVFAEVMSAYEEYSKAMPEEKPEELVKKIDLDKLIEQAFDRMERNQASKAKLTAKAANFAAQNAPMPSVKSEIGGYRDEKPRISVSEPRLYSGLKFNELALYVKIQQGRHMKNMTPGQMQNTPLSDWINPKDFNPGEFVKALGYKYTNAIETNKRNGRDDTDTLYEHCGIKANELNASDLSNQGADWVGIAYDSQVWALAEYELKLFSLLQAKGMQIKDVVPGTNTFRFLIDTSRGVVNLRSEPHSVDSTGRSEMTARIYPFTTGYVDMAGQEHVIAMSISHRLIENSMADVLQYANQTIAYKLQEAIENVIINGDTDTTTANINTDSTPPVGLLKPAYLGWNGLRKNYLVTNLSTKGLNAAGLSLGTYQDLRGKFSNEVHGKREQMLTIVSASVEKATRKLVNLITVDVAGLEHATQYTGALAPRLDGVDVYESGLLGDAQADGTISDTAGNNTKGQIIEAYAPYLGYGRKRQITINTDDNWGAGALELYGTIVHAFTLRNSDGAVGAYNVTI